MPHFATRPVSRRETFANRTEGRVRRDERRAVINGKRAFAFMGAV